MAASFEIYGPTSYTGKRGIDWWSPCRAIDEPPTDPKRHADFVARGEQWVAANFPPWLLALAHCGMSLFTDGQHISIALPSLEGPPRLVMHIIGVIDPAAQPLPMGQEGRSLQ